MHVVSQKCSPNSEVTLKAQVLEALKHLQPSGFQVLNLFQNNSLMSFSLSTFVIYSLIHSLSAGFCFLRLPGTTACGFCRAHLSHPRLPTPSAVPACRAWWWWWWWCSYVAPAFLCTQWEHAGVMFLLSLFLHVWWYLRAGDLWLMVCCQQWVRGVVVILSACSRE